MRPMILAAVMVALLASQANAQYGSRHYQSYSKQPNAVATASVKVISPNDPDWRTKALEVARERQAWEQSALRKSAEHRDYLETLSALGLTGQVAYGGATYGQSSAYGGNSLYGYSYSTVADYYNQADRATLLNQYQNTTNRAMDLAGKSSDNLRGLYSEEISTQERVASIVAERDKAIAAMAGAAQVLEASKTQHTRISTQETSVGPHAQGPSPIAVLTNKCGSCHTGNEAPAGIHLDGSRQLSLSESLASIEATQLGVGVLHADAGTVKAMPPASSGTEISREDYRAVIDGLRELIGPG